MKITAVVPAYNLEKKISSVLTSLFKFVDEVVVVDDGSRDHTFLEAKKTKAIVLKHLINRGQGAALRTGTHFACANGADIIVHFDGDGQFSGRDIKKAIEPIIKNEADIVFGSRFLDNKTKMPWSKKNIIMPLARLINSFFDINLSDPQSGFRVMSASASKKIVWHQDRMAHCTEILAEIYKLKLRVKEVPIVVRYDEYGQSLRGGLNILADLFWQKLIN